MVRELFLRVLDLGFFSGPKEITEPLYLGPPGKLSKKQIIWDIICWVLVGMGMFLRQGLDVENMEWKPERLTFGAFLASVVISFALFPWFMRWFNKRRPAPGVEHIATPFAFGFFLDLAAATIWKRFVRNVY